MNQQPNTAKRSFSFWKKPASANENQPNTTHTGTVKGSVDVPFLLITAALVLFGCVMIYSASFVFAQKHHATSTYFIVRHVIFLMMAVAFTFVVVRFCTPRFWYDFSYIFYGISIVLLLLVLTPLGTDLNSGARRWIDLKFITLQPSELAKLALVLTLARFLTTHQDKVLSHHKFGGDFKYGVFYPGLMIAGVGGLVALEKHISALAIIGMLGISLMFLGGTRIKWIASLAGVIAVAACLLIIFFPYAFARVDTWLNIEEADPLGSAWQTLQGLMAIGSGGLFGKGLGNSQQKYGFVSQPRRRWRSQPLR